MAVLGYSATLRNAQAVEIVNMIATSGLLRIYSGTQPATGGAETTLLAELALSATAGTQTGGTGVITFNAISSDTNAPASGTPTWARFTTSGGTAVIDMDAAVTPGSGEALIIDAAIVAGGTVACSAATITRGNA